jgi:hypothetical protein
MPGSSTAFHADGDRGQRCIQRILTCATSRHSAKLRWTPATHSARLSRRPTQFRGFTMRIGVLLFTVCLAAVPALARGSHGGYRSAGSRSYRTRSYTSRSYSPRVRSSHRTRSYTSHAYRSRPSYSAHRGYGTRSSAFRTSSYGTAQRDRHGRIERSEAAKDSFKREHPCPSTGRRSGACPGYVVDHVHPLASGGADAPSNMQWQTKADAKAKDKWERR